MNSKPGQTKLKPNEIRYLVLEGGGGKGFAFLGAIAVLEQLKIIQRCEGFGGASAGAITALLLSLGYDSEQLAEFMKKTNFTKFFDLAVPRRVPLTYAEYSEKGDSEEEANFIAAHKPSDLQVLLTGLAAFAKGASALGSGGARLGKPLEDVLFQLGAALMRNEAPVSQLYADWPHYLAYWPQDMGLFSGEAARNTFAAIITERAKTQDKTGAVGKYKGYRGLSFADHLKIFSKKLLLTGTNLSTGKTQMFSAEATPTFPVADAVRISMGLPWIYKPYVITNGGGGYPPNGVYVDGGVWNNLPYREFDAESAGGTQKASAATRGESGTRRSTLGLRLEVDSMSKIDSVFALSGQMIQRGILGSGETQVLDKHLDQLIVLDTCGLDLINFKPNADTLIRVVKRARREVWKYFDMDAKIPPGDRDKADEAATEGRKLRGEPCKVKS